MSDGVPAEILPLGAGAGAEESRPGDGRAATAPAAPPSAVPGTWRTRPVVTGSSEQFHRLFQSELLGAIVESSEDAIFARDLDGVIRSWNKGAEVLYGYSAEEAIGRPFSFLLPPGHEAEWNYLLQKTRDGERVERSETFRRCKDGRDVEVSVTISPVRDASGTIVGASAIARDVTEHRRTVTALRASTERYRGLFDAITDAIVVKDAERRIVEVNRTFETVFGYSRAEVIGLTTRMLFASDADAQAVSERHRARSAEFLVVRYRRKNGELFTGESTFFQVPAATGDVSVSGGVIRDVTERQRLEEQFRQAQKMEAVGRLAGGIAHDFNNVLTAVLGFADLLESRLPDDGEMQDDLRQIRVAGERAAKLTKQLLTFSRKQALAPQVLDLNDVVRGAERLLRQVIGEDVEVVLRLDAGIGKIYADGGQLEQVLMNLSINARDAMPDGGRLIIETSSVDVEAAALGTQPGTRPGKFARLSVSDNGIGMTPEVRARLFEPYFTTKEEGKGTGLGLATTFGIVKQSEGSIRVYSEQGLGSTFRIDFPVVEREVGEIAAPAPPQPAGGVETILLAEDEGGVRRILTMSLRALGYRVLSAPTGEAALEMARAHMGPIDLLLTDVIMPGMSGRDLAREIRATRPSTAIVFMSGYTDEAVVRHGMLEPGTEFLEKPFAPSTVTRRIRDVLDRAMGG